MLGYFSKLFFLLFFSFKAFSLPLIPDTIEIPKALKSKKKTEIQSVFSSLKEKHNNKTANLWLLDYQEAFLLKDKDTKLFCQAMKDLSSQPKFPLKLLAQIKSYEVCPFDEELKFEPKQFPSWLELSLAQALYKRNRLFKNPELTLKSCIYLAKNSPYKELRVSYLKHALSLLKEIEPTSEEYFLEANLLQEDDLQKLLYKESPSLNPQPKPEDYFLIAEDFKSRRSFVKAKKFYIKVLNSSETSFKQKDLSFKGLTHIYKIKRNKKKEIQSSKQWLSWLLTTNTPESLKSYYQNQLELARKEWNIDQNKKAIERLDSLLTKQLPFMVDEALHLRGAIYLQEDQQDLALKDWDTAINSLYKKKNNADLLTEILWKKAWLLRQQQKYRQAIKTFLLLKKVNTNFYMDYKILFWMAQTYQKQGRKRLAIKTYKKLAEKDSFGYYGLLAHHILNKKPKIQNKKLKEGFDFTDQELNATVHWLVLFDELSLLSLFLKEREKHILSQKDITAEEQMEIIWLWKQTNRYLDIFKFVQTIKEENRTSFFEKYLGFLFPLDFKTEVEQASKRFKLDPALVLAIIRQESAFNERARSSADAFGLMQVIPSTARQTARRHKIRYRNFKDLYRVSKNISIGSAYLRLLLNQNNNHFVYSVASYNAGSEPVKKWRQNLKDNEILEFIENIPYKETSLYVRLVLRNYIIYYNLKEDKEKDWFPSWLISQLFP